MRASPDRLRAFADRLDADGDADGDAAMARHVRLAADEIVSARAGDTLPAGPLGPR